MRLAIAVLVAALMAAGITYHVMSVRLSETQVTSFNDGFRDGACHAGQDGFGNPCQEVPR